MRLSAFAVVVLAGTATSAFAQAPAGPEFRVNTVTSGRIEAPTVAMTPAGDFVAVWGAYYGGDQRVIGQRFARDGARRGAEFTVATNIPAAAVANVAVAPSGAFIVVWAEGAPLRTYARRYDAAGGAGPTFRVGTQPSAEGVEVGSNVVADAAGNALVTWAFFPGVDEPHLRAQALDAAGARVGAEFAVAEQATGYQGGRAAMAALAGGGFLVVWSHGVTGVSTGVRGRRFTSAGLPLGAEFEVASSSTRLQYVASVTALPDGGFVVAWSDAAGKDSPWTLARERRYDAAGAPLGAERILHRWPADDVFTNPVAVASSQGRLVAAWTHGSGYDFPVGVRAGRFDLGGTARSTLELGDPTVSNNFLPAAAADADGRFVVVWQAGYFEVHGQRLGRLSGEALAMDPSSSGTSDGNGVLEPGEAAEARPSWRNLAGADQSLGGTLAGFGGPSGGVYTIVDGVGSYGTVPAGTTRPCTDCYRLSVSAAARPVLHWDAQVTESMADADGSHTQWRVHLGDSFGDVPRASGFYRFVETLLHAGVTAGCTGTSFCPSASVTREQMAPFVLTAREEAGYRPRACDAPPFGDVPVDSPFCPWIAELGLRRVVGGCGNGNYCPHDPVTREQMALFLLRTLDPALSPPACTTPLFGDVPASSPFCRWVEELARRGITAGCGGGNYCPSQPVTREQMAVFLTTTFGLTLYGP